MYSATDPQLAPYLDPGETLLWSGRPERGLKLRQSDALLIPFSLLWGGFAFFWEASVLIGFAAALQAGLGRYSLLGLVFPLFGLPFCIVGAYLIVGRFFAEARVRARTRYGVTSTRLLILAGFFTPQLKSVPLGSIGEIRMTERVAGTGTLTFTVPGAPVFGRRRRAPAFEFIEDVREVERVVRRAVGDRGR